MGKWPEMDPYHQYGICDHCKTPVFHKHELVTSCDIWWHNECFDIIDKEFKEERAAIMQHDGGLSKEEAEREAEKEQFWKYL